MNEKLEKAKKYAYENTLLHNLGNESLGNQMIIVNEYTTMVAERYHELMDEWISVDTPPTEPNEDWYLVARNEDVFVMAHTYTKGNWYGYGNVYLTEDITHYKKLPTPPKQ